MYSKRNKQLVAFYESLTYPGTYIQRAVDVVRVVIDFALQILVIGDALESFDMRIQIAIAS